MKVFISFGTYLINTLIDNPSIWTKAIQKFDHMKKTVELEIEYAKDVLPTGILGLNAPMFVDYMHYIGIEGSSQSFRLQVP